MDAVNKRKRGEILRSQIDVQTAAPSFFTNVEVFLPNALQKCGRDLPKSGSHVEEVSLGMVGMLRGFRISL